MQAEAKNDVATMIATQQAIKFNGGGAHAPCSGSRRLTRYQVTMHLPAGHVNHSIFWTNLCPKQVQDDVAACCCTPPEGELAAAIEKDFGSLSTLQSTLSAMCAADKLQARCPAGHAARCAPSQAACA